MRFNSITVALDMLGCPNRCRHCWLGHSPNARMGEDDLRFAAESFRPYTDTLEVFYWYREPDYGDNYREMWKLCGELSDRQTEHFELVGFWRIVRDPEYVKWLKDLGLKIAQLTLFGGRETTDRYTGRKGAYDEILRATDILLENGIAPRIQVFVNKENIKELEQVEALIRDLRLEERCTAIGEKFAYFVHQGSCDGENEKLYGVRVTPSDLEKIPPFTAEHTLRHFGKASLSEVFGRTEKELFEELKDDSSTADLAGDDPVFYVDREFNVYPNFTAPAPFWCLGNLKTDGAQAVLKNYSENRSVAQHVRATVPLGEIVRAQGDPESLRLFGKGDYIDYLLNRYCREIV